jgi:starvation-inducible DNA-binding protein
MSKSIEGLNVLTADAIVLFQKLHHYHWYVKGEQFFGLHTKFEELYNYWMQVFDDAAERVLTIGGEPPRTLAQSLELTTLKEDAGKPSTNDMVKNLISDFEVVVKAAGNTIKAAEDAGDRGTANLIDEVRDQTQKDIWMLKAYLKD